ncbi:MAG: pyruvate, phosphate dikinase [Deltaproteobacteria bacterium]|nr:pyruvate, phosphate dikinase [Deltaproteobacteria bacterium]
MSGHKWVYRFGGACSEGNSGMKNLLGGKGANLAEMASLGIPVPAGFTITTEVCTQFYAQGGTYPDALSSQVDEGLAHVEAAMGATFGAIAAPLLLSVRSGARASMPGMMDTVLNLGLNDATVEGLIAAGGSKRFAYDSYRRFVQMYGDVVLEVRARSKTDHDPFEELMDGLKAERGVTGDLDLGWEDLRELVARYKARILERTGRAFPDDPREQLWGAVGAVFRSWMNDRAKAYRAMNGIPEEWGTAVNIQAMVFGNMGTDCATGVGFTRDSATGEPRKNGEYLINAQGEDVVAGTRTPLQITQADSRTWAWNNGIAEEERRERYASLEEAMPGPFAELMGYYERLEKHYRDMQDVEFTIQRGRLWMLQTRNGKRTGFAACRIAVDMVAEGLIDRKTALGRVEPEQLNQLLRPIFDPAAKKAALAAERRLALGLPAGPGAATGRIVFHASDAEEWVAKGQGPVLLVRIETSPEDIRGMDASEGILTARGGMTSHAALVARQMGKVCVAGCGALDISYKLGTLRVGSMVLKEGDWLSLDGFTGEVLAGRVETRPSEVLQVLFHGAEAAVGSVFHYYRQLMAWADEVRTLEIRTNADQPDQAAQARAFGAQGIGLCRTEHMFFGEDRITAVRQMILADTAAERKVALDKLLPMQRGDFEGIFTAMDGLPVTIRTLDPPLHEFLPHTDEEIEALAKELGAPAKKLRDKAASLHEFNPMLGHRGCRLGIAYPEITTMQARAIFEAAVAVKQRGVDVHPEIMIPLVGHVKELTLQKALVVAAAEEVFQAAGLRVDYLLGTMIELPRAALTADEIAAEAEFFSFGTNDLTQTAMGLSRDDAGRFLPQYVEQKIFAADPFQSLDTTGVGQLVRIAVEKGRAARPGIKLGICGEHGGDPASIAFFHEVGLRYVSCSPPRVPIARLAAARAALR